MGFLEDENIENNANLAEAIARLNSYDLILFLEPDVTWVQDGDRSEVMAANRIHYSDQIQKIYKKYGFSFHVISGNYLKRFEQAVALIDELLSQNSF